MILGKVIGVVWGTKKSETVRGYKIVMVRPVSLPLRVAEMPPKQANMSVRKAEEMMTTFDLTRMPDESHLSSGIILAVDCLDACVGDFVITAMGTRVRDITLDDTVPTKTVVLGIVDAATLYPDCI